nr:MAG TPA: hypothetical protein [Bacteriophage sp.]
MDSRENCNEISDIIVGHFNYCDRLGRISRLRPCPEWCLKT